MMETWMDRYKDGRIDRWMNELMEVQMDISIDRYKDGRIDRWVVG